MRLLIGILTVLILLTTVSADVVTDSGALTSIDIFSEDQTDNWAGLYGNISGVKAVGTRNTLFEWGSNEARYVYFSRSDIDFFSRWSAGNRSLLKSEYSFLENSTDGANTFNSSIEVDTTYQNNTIEAPAASTSNSSGLPYWKTGYLYDGSQGFFVAEVKDGRAFDGSRANYQVLLPENGADTSPTEFEIWVELVEG